MHAHDVSGGQLGVLQQFQGQHRDQRMPEGGGDDDDNKNENYNSNTQKLEGSEMLSNIIIKPLLDSHCYFAHA